jgi:glycosyltransferase involved in cell wall biosynthesis
MTPPTLAIVIPCYNEQEVLPETLRRLRLLLQRLVAERRVALASRV